MNEVEIIAARDHVSPSLRNEKEYKLPVVDKSSSNAIAHFYVEYCNGRKTEFRKCMKCGERLKCPNAGTSSLQLLKPAILVLLNNCDLFLPDFDWLKISKIINVLKPLQELTLLLQNPGADVLMGVTAIKFLKHIAAQEPALNSPIQHVLKKHIDGNAVVNAIVYNHGVIYDSLKSMYVSNVDVQAPSRDHEYNTKGPI